MAPDILIADPTDPRIAEYRNLSDAELLRDRRAFIAEGRLVVRRLLAASPYGVRSVLVTPAARASLDDVLAASAAPTFICSLEVLQQITGFNIHRGCLAIGERPDALNPRTFLEGAGPIVVLEGVGNADNVGLIFRNAAAFGASAVVLDATCCDPLYRKSVRTSMGAALSVPFAIDREWPSFVAALRDAHWTVLAMTPSAPARDLEEVRRDRPHRIAILLGSEGQGLSETALTAAGESVRIHMSERTDSLNVAVAAGIALYALTR